MKYTLVHLLLISFLLSACKVENPSSTSSKHIGKIDMTKFSKRLDATDDAYLIDVRTPEEFAEGHLDGALNINYYDADFAQQMDKLDKKKPLFLYCRSGNRSGKATNLLEKAGWTEIYDMEGGYKAWSAAGK